ncbi:complement C1r subcomponent-like protein [Acomys russatus]|uniref:complement C1r subcomponent-like protein n=1 Tax=Acomys russatus TaxID=60746 RepID=UPI0021E23B7F|nr:complement C1r subcomponent-like protein [Acomys russatus]
MEMKGTDCRLELALWNHKWSMAVPTSSITCSTTTQILAYLPSNCSTSLNKVNACYLLPCSALATPSQRCNSYLMYQILHLVLRMLKSAGQSPSLKGLPDLTLTCSRGLVPPELENHLWSSPSTRYMGKMCWLLLWGVLQTCPTKASVLLAQQLPQQLTSPGYPEPYVKGQESHADIEAPEGFAVRLFFQDFDLEPSPGCEGDSVIISTRGTDATRLCGQHGSSLGSPPGLREFVSLGRSLRLTFRAHSSSKNKTTNLHKGFLALYQAIAVSQPNGDAEAVTTSGADPPKIQNHCQDPYYQAGQTGTISGPSLGDWKDRQDGDILHCVPVCGRPVIPVTQDPKTSGSSRAKLGNFPWQAFTSIYGRGGGALLGDKWILTAAHTIYPKDSIYLRKNRSVEVFLGHTDIDELLKLGSHPVRRVVVHPDYRPHESHNFNGDIALLELQHSVPLGPNLLPVCLPDNETLYHSGLWGYVSGFGVEMGWLTTKLKYSKLPVAPRQACEAWLRRKQRTEVFSDNMFCVGDELQTNSVCQGDSGSVYVVWDDRARHWVATGIVSWGVGCGKGYGFYTKVLNYVDWIKRVMEGKD